MSWPPLFASWTQGLSVFSLDFVALDCLRGRSGFLWSVGAWAALTPALAAASRAALGLQRFRLENKFKGPPGRPGKPPPAGVETGGGGEDAGGSPEASAADELAEALEAAARAHTYRVLSLSYLVLPPVLRMQFQVLFHAPLFSGGGAPQRENEQKIAWSAHHNRKMTHLSPDSFERPGGGGDHTRAHQPLLRPWPAASAYGFLAPEKSKP